MQKFLAFGLYIIVLVTSASQMALAQSETLRIATVSRAPFSMVKDGVDTGFSIDLMAAVAADLKLDYTIDRQKGFSEMLDLVQQGQADAAIANISITAQRETILDFTQPIFESGLQVLLHDQGFSNSITGALFTKDIAIAVLLALGLLFGGGMVMWLFERRRQEYFDRPLPQAMFPSFWWALNLVVNGGFEERMPRSPGGRVFGVLLVISSLFIVSVFVAKITAAMTVSAIQSNVQSINDLDGRRIGTITGATAANFLASRDLPHRTYNDLETLLAEFEENRLDAVVFDAPILAFYVQTQGQDDARLLDRIFKPENYGIALPTGSPLREEFNQSLLRLREDGTYNKLVVKWFGSNYLR